MSNEKNWLGLYFRLQKFICQHVQAIICIKLLSTKEHTKHRFA